MSKAKLKKLAPRVLIIFFVIYLLCLIYCGVSVFKMQTLTYNSTGWGIVLTEYKLDFVGDLTVLNYYDFDGTLSTHTQNTFSPAQQTKVRLVCAISLMPLWRGEYDNPYVMDGDQWHTIITYGNREKTTYGSNSYPLTYCFVHNTIISIFDTIK
ncbi:MAG: hypothetical protein RR954_09155 [Christensenellaceae bacterium]